MHIVVYGGCVPRKSLGAGAVGGRARVVARERRVILLLFVASVASVAFGRCERCDDVTCLLVVTRTKFVIVTFFYTLSPARPNEAPRVPTQALVSRAFRSKSGKFLVRTRRRSAIRLRHATHRCCVGLAGYDICFTPFLPRSTASRPPPVSREQAETPFNFAAQYRVSAAAAAFAPASRVTSTQSESMNSCVSHSCILPYIPYFQQPPSRLFGPPSFEAQATPCFAILSLELRGVPGSNRVGQGHEFESRTRLTVVALV